MLSLVATTLLTACLSQLACFVRADYETTFYYAQWKTGFNLESYQDWATREAEVISEVDGGTAHLVHGKKWGTQPFEGTLTIGPQTFDYRFTDVFSGTETQITTSACSFAPGDTTVEAWCWEFYTWKYTFTSSPFNPASPLGSYSYAESTYSSLGEGKGVFVATLAVREGEVASSSVWEESVVVTSSSVGDEPMETSSVVQSVGGVISSIGGSSGTAAPVPSMTPTSPTPTSTQPTVASSTQSEVAEFTGAASVVGKEAVWVAAVGFAAVAVFGV